MKIRNGFISNSSSSSFIVAFKKDDTESLNYLDIVKFHKDAGKLDNYDNLNRDLITSKQDEIKELKKDIPFTKKNIEFLKNINNDTKSNLSKVMYMIKDHSYWISSEDALRLDRKYEGETKTENLIDTLIDDYQDHIKFNTKKITTLKDEIALFKPYLNNKYEVVTFEEDNWDAKIGIAIEKLAKKNKCIILKKVVN